ncbi:hypothetical protein ILUMI_00456 [Ignelater luminosus]|uniref:PiggyBac transposable element-derived protein domain-containing protein n=1 Tax=Ignelater luminosus TaxID=2038154 RepID=A0A8K0DKD6_IGNLU|nr:hypothetical protein ILUMI_00456 [Ignelater luminosus]
MPCNEIIPSTPEEVKEYIGILTVLVYMTPKYGKSNPTLKTGLYDICTVTTSNEYGLRAAGILELESRLPKEPESYNFYFDNFFTRLPLLSARNVNKIGGTGTIHDNRLAKCPIMQVSW